MPNPKKYLTRGEIQSLRNATRRLDYNLKYDTYILLSFRHGLRLSEALQLLWDDIDWGEGGVFIRRAKNGIDSNHPINSEELGLLKRLERQRHSPYIFQSNRRGKPLGNSAVQSTMIKLGGLAGLGRVHPHQLRHSCGYYLARKGVDAFQIQQWMGHRNIKNTLVYINDAAKNLEQLRNW